MGFVAQLLIACIISAAAVLVYAYVLKRVTSRKGAYIACGVFIIVACLIYLWGYLIGVNYNEIIHN